jgi:hypothetical protein
MCNCAPGYFCLDLFSIFRVIALDLENVCNFQLVSHVTQKGFDIESLNLTGRLLSIYSCAPGVSIVDLSSICRVISLDLIKTFHYVVICSWSAWVRIDQHHCETLHLGLCMWIFFSVLLPMSYSSINLNFSTCSCIAQKVFDM